MTGQLWPYIKAFDRYHCPLDYGPWPATSVSNLTSYIMNGSMSAFNGNGNHSYKLRQFQATNIVYWEFSWTLGQTTNGSNDVCNWPGEGITARHIGGTTVSYIDGHVDVMSGATFNSYCQVPLAGGRPNCLYCSPIDADGGYSRDVKARGGTMPNPIPIFE